MGSANVQNQGERASSGVRRHSAAEVGAGSSNSTSHRRGAPVYGSGQVEDHNSRTHLERRDYDPVGSGISPADTRQYPQFPTSQSRDYKLQHLNVRHRPEQNNFSLVTAVADRALPEANQHVHNDQPVSPYPEGHASRAAPAPSSSHSHQTANDSLRRDSLGPRPTLKERPIPAHLASQRGLLTPWSHTGSGNSLVSNSQTPRTHSYQPQHSNQGHRDSEDANTGQGSVSGTASSSRELNRAGRTDRDKGKYKEKYYDDDK